MLERQEEFAPLCPLADIDPFGIVDEQYALEEIEDRFFGGLIPALGAADGVPDVPLIFRVCPVGENGGVGPVNGKAGNCFPESVPQARQREVSRPAVLLGNLVQPASQDV